MADVESRRRFLRQLGGTVVGTKLMLLTGCTPPIPRNPGPPALPQTREPQPYTPDTGTRVETTDAWPMFVVSKTNGRAILKHPEQTPPTGLQELYVVTHPDPRVAVAAIATLWDPKTTQIIPYREQPVPSVAYFSVIQGNRFSETAPVRFGTTQLSRAEANAFSVYVKDEVLKKENQAFGRGEQIPFTIDIDDIPVLEQPLAVAFTQSYIRYNGRPALASHIRARFVFQDPIQFPRS